MNWITAIFGLFFAESTEPYRQGDKAYMNGSSEEANPYVPGSRF